ncbi:mitotic checkpoint regulator, MAD2B-interacting-domain-containing protein [Aspergillus pseudoustus]|uniref:Mitotic checkpoint regulator, MAD2B-interacting-domain-containing protein n=1 Tax=Aspergillus pseudoustus TaxID=1810923 RepID=A0ABR4KEF6_9EURO
MVLVAYSDSEASDSEVEEKAAPTTSQKPTPASKPTTQPPKPTTIVDRTNPRKIRVALPDTKPENADPDADADGPARKKPRIGGGRGGAFAGFNSFLPPPKRTNAAVEQEKNKVTGASGQRKVFSLKTGAAPGFDRGADEEMRREFAFAGLSGNVNGEGDDETIPKAGSLREEEVVDSPQVEKKTEEVVLKGNPMMFKPLSVARSGQKKKKKTMATSIPPPVAKEPKEGHLGVGMGGGHSILQLQAQKPVASPAVPKPKVSLFSLSSEETTFPKASAAPQGSTYEPLIYNTNEDTPAAGPAPETESVHAAPQTVEPSAQTLDHIADDLSLSRSQRRQLFGRNADASKSRILHFNTDAEYAANQEMANKDLAATQHNPVRAIAPGKHTLQQLVNAASSQKEALEESFASGKRNKKEAGARYGW